jgi:hypothetical protein
LHPDINTEVDDFFARHIDAIAEAMREPDVVHGPHCTNGKRVWMFDWHWPFVHTWISNAICVCDINQIMRLHNESMRLMDDIVRALRSEQRYDLYAGFSQKFGDADEAAAEKDKGEKQA